MQKVKRFIAGVVCPKCAANDSIRAWRDEACAVQYRECVDCGYQDSISDHVQVNPPSEIMTRVSESPLESNIEAQPIKIIGLDGLPQDH